jgi:hypothetical protein
MLSLSWKETLVQADRMKHSLSLTRLAAVCVAKPDSSEQPALSRTLSSGLLSHISQRVEVGLSRARSPHSPPMPGWHSLFHWCFHATQVHVPQIERPSLIICDIILPEVPSSLICSSAKPKTSPEKGRDPVHLCVLQPVPDVVLSVRTMRTFPLVRTPKILLLPWFPVMIHMRYLSECVQNSTQFLHLPFFSLHSGLTRCSCVDLQVPAEAAEAAEGWWCAKIPHL